MPGSVADYFPPGWDDHLKWCEHAKFLSWLGADPYNYLSRQIMITSGAGMMPSMPKTQNARGWRGSFK